MYRMYIMYTKVREIKRETINQKGEAIWQKNGIG